MTRFARAHGSKSSNEKLPEEATSWTVMKQQLQDKLQSSESVANPHKSKLKIWKSSDFEPDAWNRKNAVWVAFEEHSGSINRSKKNPQLITQKTKKGDKRKNSLIVNDCVSNLVDSQKKSKNKKLKGLDASETDIHDLSDYEDKPLNTISTTKTKKKKLKNVNAENCDNSEAMKITHDVVVTFSISQNFTSAKKRKTKNKLRRWKENELVQKVVSSSLQETGENATEKSVVRKRKRDSNSISEMGNDPPVTKLQHKNQGNGDFESSHYTQSENFISELKNEHRKKKKYTRDENQIEEVTNTFQVRQSNQKNETETQQHTHSGVQTVKKKKHKQKKHLEKSFHGNDTLSSKKESLSQESKAQKSSNSYIQIEKKKKQPKWQHQNDKIIERHNFGTDNMRKKHENRKKNENVTVLHLNGREIEIVKFDGFPVKREDAENLRILKQKLIANGVPSNEIKTTMKLERRKAEKALAREKKKVCFHCRNSGHVLSECPKLEKAEMEDASGTGICFKCGSTEHKHFECRVTRDQEFRYAKCFVCNEQGHIARQCPDNPRGLYPKGGGCHVCGDVTHLKKDCPDLTKEKEQKTIRLPTLSSKSLEVLEDDNKNGPTEPTKHSNKKKTVIF